MGIVRCLILLQVLAVSATLRAQPSLLLIDRSGSMKPYYEAGVVAEIVGEIVRAGDGGPLDLAAFSTDVQPVSDFSRIASLAYGKDTYLDHALDFAGASSRGTAWILTDNIQDPAGSASVGNTRVFYERLKSEGVRRVTIFPILQPPGRSGLVIYALLLDPAQSELYARRVQRLQRDAAGSLRQALHMKPLDRDTVDIRVVQDSRSEGAGGGRYKVGEVVRETISLRFLSKFEHLKIENATIEVSESQAEFGPESFLRAEKGEVSITPVTVENLEPGGETEQVYQVTFDLGRVRLKRDLASLWGAAFGRARETQELTLSFVINVPQRNFRFKQPFLAEYNAATLEEAKASGRVYGIEDLPILVGERATIILSERKFPIQIDYPIYPALIFLALFLGAIAALGAVVYGVAAGGRRLLAGSGWRVSASDERGGEIESEVTGEGDVMAGGAPLGSVRDDRFRVGQGVLMLEPESADEVALENGLEVKLVSPEAGTILLRFRSGRGPSGADRAPQPTRR